MRILVFAACLAIGLAPTRALGCEDVDRDGFFDLDGCGTLRDCHDQDPWTSPAAIETCNGRDDDCDGALDEGCAGACTTPQRRSGQRRVDGSEGAQQRMPSLTRAEHGYGVTWNQPVGQCQEIRFARLDESGKQIGVATSMRALAGGGQAKWDTAVAWTGRSFAVAFSDADAQGCTTPGVQRPYVQFLDPQGRPMGGPVLLSPQLPHHSGASSLAFNGREVVALWVMAGGNASDGLYGARFTPKGVCLDPDGIRLLSYVSPSGPDWVRIVWNGELFGVAWTQHVPGTIDNGDVNFQRFDEDLRPIDPAPRRVAPSANPSRSSSLVWADGEWGLAWEEDIVYGYHEIVFARLDTTGTLVSPPGVVQVTTGAHLPGNPNRQLPDIEWTGSEYGIVYGNKSHPTSGEGDLWLARVSANGVHLGSDLLITPEPPRQALFQAMAWNGVDYGLVWQDSTPGLVETRFVRVGCGCADLDGDGFSSCAGGDCDDQRFDVNVLRPEQCGNGADDDCDGLADCRDVAACPSGSPPPGAVAGVQAMTREQWTWLAVGGADRYDVARGRLETLRDLGSAAESACLDADLLSPGFADPEVPALGGAFYYAVRSEAGAASACRQSDWGTQSDAVVEACP